MVPALSMPIAFEYVNPSEAGTTVLRSTRPALVKRAACDVRGLGPRQRSAAGHAARGIDCRRSALVAPERERRQGAIRDRIDRATREEAAGETGDLSVVVDAQGPLQRDRGAHAAAFEPGADRTDADDIPRVAWTNGTMAVLRRSPPVSTQGRRSARRTHWPSGIELLQRAEEERPPVAHRDVVRSPSVAERLAQLDPRL